VSIARVSHNSSLNSPVVHNRQNQCCALAWDSRASFQCSEVLELRPALKFSLLLKLAKVLNLGLTEFCELFVELQHWSRPLFD
jgi:hypothetical protein